MTVPGLPLVSPLLNTLLGTLSAAQAAINDDMTEAAGAAGVPFVPIPFSLQGHEMCTSNPYIVSIGLVKGAYGDRNLGHPNVPGSAAIASAVGSALGLAPASSGGGGGGGGGGGQDGPLRPAPRVRQPGGTHRASGPVRRGWRPADDGSLSFPGGTLSDGTVGGGYVDYLVATGGTGADTWSVTGGSLPPGLSLDQNSGTITGTPTTTGSYTFTAQVTDSSTPTPQTASAQVTITVHNAPSLAVASTQPADATVGQPYAFAESASGGLGQVTWSVTAGALPAGLHLSAATGQITGTPAVSDAGTTDYTVQASDSSSPAQVATADESVTVHPTSDPLTVTTNSLPEVTAGQPYAAQFASTGGVAPVQWSVTSGSLPPGLSLDAATGVLSGTPVAAGTYDLTAQVTDGTAPVSQTASADLSITVDPPPALGITTGALLDGTQGTPYSSTVQATGGAGAYSWQVSSGDLPAGLSLDGTTGQVTGTPAGSGTSTFGITVTDAAGDTATQAYQITIAPTAALTVSSTLPPSTVGTYYTGNVTPSGGLAPYGWSLVLGTLPAGLYLTPPGRLAGTPTGHGISVVTVQVTDGASDTATRSVKLTVDPDAPLTVTTADLDDATQGSDYAQTHDQAQTFSAAGGVGSYAWTLAGGRLPAGLQLTQTGTIQGTPTHFGSSTFTVKVTDLSTPTAQTATRRLSLTVQAEPVFPPSITADSPDSPLAAGASYSYEFAAAGNPGPAFSVSSGSLPPGLRLRPDGLLTGTPGRAGTYTFEVTASNGRSPDAVSPDLQIIVLPAPVIVSVTPDEAVPGTTVVIGGKNLQDASYVDFDGSYALITSDTATQIVTSVPEFAGSGHLYVATQGGYAQSPTPFTVDPAPAPDINSISPTSGSPGSTLTIDGTGLEFAYEVEFGGQVFVSDGELDSDTPTSIELPIPAGASAGPVTVFTDGGSATSAQTFIPSG